MRYAIVIEQSGTGFAAYVPDLPGCVAAGQTRAEVEERIRGAIEMHLAGLRADGHSVPAPSSAVEYIDIAA